MKQISFKPKQVSKKLLSNLNPRTKEVISNRFGLENEEKMTLEAIGKNYSITRERVRQIENFAINAIKKSQDYRDHAFIFDELKEIFKELGELVSEETALAHIAKDKISQNHINFYLVLGDDFTKLKEDEDFKHRWTTNDKIAKSVEGSLKSLHSSLSKDTLLSEEKVVEHFVSALDEVVTEYKENKDIINKYLNISKILAKNELNEWGHAGSHHVKARGIKDYAYLVMRRKGEPMHYKDVAAEINTLFGKKAHVATCHNELIKDDRFVLVGRGMYGLKEWGHTGGVVRDVISLVLDEAGTSLNKDEIIKRVIAKRMVKPNTVMVNLQNTKYFKKDSKGLYSKVK